MRTQRALLFLKKLLIGADVLMEPWVLQVPVHSHWANFSPCSHVIVERLGSSPSSEGLWLRIELASVRPVDRQTAWFNRNILFNCETLFPSEPVPFTLAKPLDMFPGEILEIHIDEKTSGPVPLGFNFHFAGWVEHPCSELSFRECISVAISR